ncbi:putative dimethylallyl tryptophan synthase [Aspergillus nomiae NRRL 13137]|uniref:Putative dimethylallyl tryptophan synthase n=1 Tax=Aspergillus nomiae NRRL (strain ATCC 15546 / NRRL 13137 / CBS 260.88 / M93) TaxID=1509407 RepID=A0A0L1JI69_ASPN3|nr:putative dimethylallyl tryptophan synthase [Aspergillus nomiae NRRL 13137]KNG91098.1 putative dimethylallyl tryptophan synthase [Aspergillus nomiae NRRL 13137]
MTTYTLLDRADAPQASSDDDEPEPCYLLSKYLTFPSFDQHQWWHNTAPMLGKLLSQCKYSVHEQYQYLCLYGLHIVPFLGPWPDIERRKLYKSVFSGLGPLEFSQNFTKIGRTVRIGFEPTSFNASTGHDICNRHALGEALNRFKHLGLKLDLQLYHQLISQVSLTDEEEYTLHARGILDDEPAKSQSLLALDFNNSDVTIKLYFYPQLKSLTTGISRARLMFSAVRNVDKCGALRQSMDMIEEYFASVPGTTTPYWVSCDLTEPRKTRFKFYFAQFQVSIENAVSLWTLDGRITDPETMAGLAMLRELWHSFDIRDGLREQKNRPGNPGDPGNVVPMLFNLETFPDKAYPQPKIYFPTTGMNDLAVAKAMVEFFRGHGLHEHAESYIDDLASYV